MYGDESEALEGLRRSEERLGDYARSCGLVLREEQPYPGYLPAAQQPGPVKHAVWSLAGKLPGGTVGRLHHQAVFGSVFGTDIAGQHTLMVCRIPESVGYVPMLACRLYMRAAETTPGAEIDRFTAEAERIIGLLDSTGCPRGGDR